MQQYSNQYSQKQYSNLARTGKAILESKVAPFYLDHQLNLPKNSNIPPQQYPRIVNASINPTALLQKLTLKRLRKMQALVRGFLVRRITYPRLLKRYRICQKVFESISSTCILEQCSSIVLEMVSQNKNTKELSYESKNEKILFLVANSLVENMTLQLTKQIIATCVSQGIAKKKPAIKVEVAENRNMFRMNVPEQRTAKQVIYNYIDKIRQDMAKNIIKEVVDELRIERIAEDYILKQKLVPVLAEEAYTEYVNQILLEEVSNRIIEDTFQSFSRTLVKYETQKYSIRAEEMGAREAQTALFHLMVGEQLFQMISAQQFQ